jgi:hypothetical protein
MTGGALTLVLIATAAAQTAAAPTPVPFGLRWGLAAPAEVTFEAATSVGPVSGTLDLVRLDVRGLEGVGRFEMRGAFDPGSVDVGDELLNGHIARWVLRSKDGAFVFGATRRLPPLAKAGEGAKPEDELFGAGVYLDQRRGGKYLEVRYRFYGNPDGTATLEMQYTAPLEDLGLLPPKHPFVEMKGPITVRVKATLVRQ